MAKHVLVDLTKHFTEKEWLDQSAGNLTWLRMKAHVWIHAFGKWFVWLQLERKKKSDTFWTDLVSSWKIQELVLAVTGITIQLSSVFELVFFYVWKEILKINKNLW